jgi:hypothetical protein
MKDPQLDALLRSVPEPDRPDEYWRDFPAETLRRRGHRNHVAPRRKSLVPQLLRWSPLAAVLVAAWAGWLRHPVRTPEIADPELQEIREVWQELSILFPHQLRAVVLEPEGPRILLAETPDLPDSAPLLVRSCNTGTCRVAVTFSGQRIELGGETLDVLSTADGRILVAGSEALWPMAPGRSHLNAQPLSGPL